MNITILDDYQDAVRKLPCAAKLDGYNAKVFTNTVKGIGQLSVRLRDAEVLVLIRQYRTTLDQLNLLTMALSQAREMPKPDVFVRAHIASLEPISDCCKRRSVNTTVCGKAILIWINCGISGV